MKRMFLLAFLFAFLFAFNFAASAQKQTECFVSGTVLDSFNKPVANAHIILDTPPTTWEDLIITVNSDENGKFFYGTRCPFPNGGKQTLYVSSQISFDGKYVPFQPPFRTGNKLGNSFAGLTVINRKRRDVDLGNVSVQVYFSNLVVRFLDDAGNSLFNDKIEWNGISIRLRSGEQIVSEAFIPRNSHKDAIRIDKSEIAMSLPEGDWTIEVKFVGGDWLKPDRVLSVRKSNNETQEILRMATK